MICCFIRIKINEREKSEENRETNKTCLWKKYKTIIIKCNNIITYGKNNSSIIRQGFELSIFE